MTGMFPTAAAEAIVVSRTKGQRWRRRYGLAAVGAGIILFWTIIAILAPVLAPYSPYEVDVTARLKPPSAEYWLGTDALGRDVLSRLLYGARTSLFIGISVVLIGAAAGALVGGVAGFVGGRIEAVLMRFTDLVLCFPPIVLALALAAALGIGTVNTVIAMLVVWWPKFARLARSLVLVQRGQEYVEAAHVIGYGPVRILIRHILPNAVGPFVVLMTLDVGAAIITFAGLSFLGLGVVPPTAEWGAMISDGRELVDQWWSATFPGLALFTVVMAFNFLGDGIRDWLDPRARRR